jgi:uncharacterized membrane protein
MMRMVQAVEVFATGLITGIFVMSAFAVLPAAAKLDDSAHVLMRQHLTRPLSRFMPPLLLLPIAASIGAVTLCRTSVSLLLDTFACFLSLATVAITVGVNGPLSRQFARWNSEALPRDWQREIRRWNIAHFVRMVASVGAFVCAILAAS